MIAILFCLCERIVWMPACEGTSDAVKVYVRCICTCLSSFHSLVTDSFGPVLHTRKAIIFLRNSVIPFSVQYRGGVVPSPSLGVLRSRLDAVLGSPFRVTLPEQGFEQGDLRRSLQPQPFCPKLLSVAWNDCRQLCFNPGDPRNCLREQSSLPLHRVVAWRPPSSLLSSFLAPCLWGLSTEHTLKGLFSLSSTGNSLSVFFLSLIHLHSLPCHKPLCLREDGEVRKQMVVAASERGMGDLCKAVRSPHQGNAWLMMPAGGRNYFFSKLFFLGFIFFLSNLFEPLFPKNEW